MSEKFFFIFLLLLERNRKNEDFHFCRIFLINSDLFYFIVQSVRLHRINVSGSVSQRKVFLTSSDFRDGSETHARSFKSRHVLSKRHKRALKIYASPPFLLSNHTTKEKKETVEVKEMN